jgi:O-antigen biosynthesis protein
MKYRDRFSEPGGGTAEAPQVRVALGAPLPAPLEVGGGTAIRLQGSCVAPGARVVDLHVRVGDNEAPATQGLPAPEEIAGSGWWEALVPIAPVAAPAPARVELRVRLKGRGVVTRDLGSIRLEPGVARRTATGEPAVQPLERVAVGGTRSPSTSDLVAICLATYDPPLDLLRRQIDSIKAQTHRNWVCIVSDDCSPLEKWRELVRLVGDDERFRLERAHRRGGFYVNFERTLRAAPPEAAYVAFADQDDRWYEDKLETLIVALGEDDVLAHSDARIVGADGEPISPTFWPRIPPRHDGLGALLVASAVTGASCLFRRSVLDWALPFPPPVGTAYHDRWIALVASVLGGIAYVERPLYDYVQHGAATLGHTGATEDGRPRDESRLRSFRRRLADLRRRRFHPNWRAAYDNVLVRSIQEAEVLRLRLGERMTPAERRSVDRIARLAVSPSVQARILVRHMIGAPGRRPGREGALLRGVSWRRLVRVRSLVHSVLAAVRPPLGALVRGVRAATVAALGALVRLRVPLPRAARRIVHVPASPRAEARLREELRREEPTAPADGPLVSIVIPSRDGREHLERLLPALERTRYRSVEVVVVDNGSADGSADWLRSRRTPLPLRVIANEDNRSFAEAINQGIGVSAGELALLLNNDVEPAGTQWLGLMVETIRERDTACVGARLIYPRRVGLRNAGDEVFEDLTLQHRGIHFVGDREGVPRPRNLGSGEDPRSAEARAVREVPAVTAACMLVRRRALEDAGVLDEGYLYGTEDTDLCLRFRERGMRVAYDGRAAVFHHEFATQNVAGSEAKRRNRAHNRSRFAGRWGARLHRQVLADRLRGGGRWSEAPLRFGITVTRDSERATHGDYHTARELGAELRRLGFEITYLESYRERWRRRIGSVDVLISLLDAFPLDQVPPGIVSIAWVRNWTERWIDHPWFDDYDIVLASSERSRRMIEERSSQVTRLMPLATNPDRFQPTDPDPRLAADLLFVGSYWSEPRQVEEALPALTGEMEVKAFGGGWEAVAAMDGVHAGRLDYERLPAAYSSARVVVDDSAHHTRRYGAVNSRVFDALACGALVASNDAEGVREIFDDEFPVWGDAASLRAHARSAANDPGGAMRLTDRYRAEVLAYHTYAHRARQIRDVLAEWCEATRFGICVGVPRRELVESWGDYHYARALQRQLERRGHPTRVHLLPDWKREHPAADDVCLHLFGLSALDRRPGQLGVIWNISHPELVTAELLDSYDLALIASLSFAAELAERTTTPVHFLGQATDPERFYPDPGPERYELLFVGNSRKVRRPVVADAARSGYELTVYGGDWTPDLVDPRALAGSSIPNAELRRHYSAADIVLNDHWAEMRAHGFLSNRLYDALACASCVVSDHVAGIEEEFDGAVVTFADAEGLRRAIDRLMRNPAERAERAERGRRAVLERHTFDRRVEELLGWVRPLVAERPRIVAADEPDASWFFEARPLARR